MYNDGYLIIRHRELKEYDGWEPKYDISETEKIRFQERTVGVTRYYSALHADQHLEIVVRIPMRPIDEDDDFILFNNRYQGEEFSVLQYQVPSDVYPKVLDISLGFKTYVKGHEDTEP